MNIGKYTLLFTDNLMVKNYANNTIKTALMDEFTEIILSLEASAKYLTSSRKALFYKDLGRLQERLLQRELFYTKIIKEYEKTRNT